MSSTEVTVNLCDSAPPLDAGDPAEDEDDAGEGALLLQLRYPAEFSHRAGGVSHSLSHSPIFSARAQCAPPDPPSDPGTSTIIQTFSPKGHSVLAAWYFMWVSENHVWHLPSANLYLIISR